MPRGRGRGRATGSFSRAVHRVMRKTDHDLVLGRKLVLSDDPPAITLNPINSLTLHFPVKENINLTFSDLFKALSTRYSIQKTSPLFIALVSVKVYSQRPGDIITISVPPTVGWIAKKEFVDAGTPSHFARVGYLWPRADQDVFVDTSGLSYSVVSVKAQAAMVYINIKWRYQTDNANGFYGELFQKSPSTSSTSWDEVDETVAFEFQSLKAEVQNLSC